MASELLAKYGGPAPRYTSYPTAPHFHAGIDAAAYRTWLGGLGSDAPLSLYVHVPFCDTLCWFCGCSTQVVRRRTTLDRYVAALEREAALVAAALPRPPTVTQVHFGGGSPTILPPDLVTRLTGALARHFDVTRDAELAVEIDPRDFDRDALAAWVAAGLSRASLGVQDFDPAVQAAINRHQSREETARVVAWLRAAGVRSLNIDLLYGLPHQTVERLLATLEAVIDLGPDRIALFGYAHVPWMKPHQRLIDEHFLPDLATRLHMSTMAGQRLVAAGYRAIGLDHFARPEDALAQASLRGTLRRNFQGYAANDAGTVLGLGASAIGTLPQGYVQNTASVRDYLKALEGRELAIVRGIALGAEDRLRRRVIMQLMCAFEADLPALAAAEATSGTAEFSRELETLAAMEADGLVRRDGATITVTEAGRPYVRAVAALFDSYLRRGTGRHSHAV